MKKRSKLIIGLALSVLALGGIAGGITYAGFNQSVAITQNVKTQRYLFLDVSSWRQGDVATDYYVYMFTTNVESVEDYDEDVTAKQWYKGTLYGGYVYWFYVPTKYDHCLFVRAKSGASLSNIQAWTKDADNIWTQTEDIELAQTNDAPNYFNPDLSVTNGVNVTSMDGKVGKRTLSQIDSIAKS